MKKLILRKESVRRMTLTQELKSKELRIAGGVTPGIAAYAAVASAVGVTGDAAGKFWASVEGEDVGGTTGWGYLGKKANRAAEKLAGFLGGVVPADPGVSALYASIKFYF